MVRHLGRWMEHSAAARPLEGRHASEVRALARAFRARAFDVTVDTLLRPADEPAPQINEAAPIWPDSDLD